jgi:hypothetical protein
MSARGAIIAPDAGPTGPTGLWLSPPSLLIKQAPTQQQCSVCPRRGRHALSAAAARKSGSLAEPATPAQVPPAVGRIRESYQGDMNRLEKGFLSPMRARQLLQHRRKIGRDPCTLQVEPNT